MPSVLIVLTNVSRYERSGEATGLWLSELTHMRDPLLAAGYEVTLASPRGGSVPIDPRSAKDAGEMGTLLADTKPLSDISPSEYVAVFFAGGHGAVFDFKDAEIIGETIRKIALNGGVVSAVCHGVAALLSYPEIVQGRAVTGFSTLEERLIGKAREVPYLLETELKQRGGLYSRARIPFTPYAVADGRLVTGQNPQSTKAVARLLLRVLAGKKGGSVYTNAKCAVCLFGTWATGLAAVSWGVLSIFGSPELPLLFAVPLIVIALAFLWYQYPLRPCSRCVARVRTQS